MTPLPKELEPIRNAARQALGRLKPADDATADPQGFLFSAKRSEAGRQLPPYYLVYFLLVDLLTFKNIGKFEKIAWSVPIDLDGRAFLIEHRKFGLGIFAQKLPDDELPAAEIAQLITKAAKQATPYFEWRAREAAAASALNVHNLSAELHARFQYFVDAAAAKDKEAEARKDESIKTPLGPNSYSLRFPALALSRESRWLRLSAVEHFYSWTEHVFIHIAILMGKVTTGNAVAKLANANWGDKYKTAFDIAEPTSKRLLDELLILRRQVRNFVAHGSFGKDGEAFSFHSGAGAVPMRFSEDRTKSQLIFGTGLDFNGEAALELIDRFIQHLWSGPRAPARIYIQDSALPLILSYASNGIYRAAMQSENDMAEFTDGLAEEFDRSANMDF